MVNQALHNHNIDLIHVDNTVTVYLAMQEDDRKEVATGVLGFQQGRRQALDEAMRKVRVLFKPYKENM